MTQTHSCMVNHMVRGEWWTRIQFHTFKMIPKGKKEQTSSCSYRTYIILKLLFHPCTKYPLMCTRGFSAVFTLPFPFGSVCTVGGLVPHLCCYFVYSNNLGLVITIYILHLHKVFMYNYFIYYLIYKCTFAFCLQQLTNIPSQ